MVLMAASLGKWEKIMEVPRREGRGREEGREWKEGERGDRWSDMREERYESEVQ